MINKITPQKAKQMMDANGDFYLVDVRCEDEYEQGHIKGALLIPLCELRCKAAKIIPNKTKLVLVYCRSGARSAQGAYNLSTMGYVKICDLGGILSWPYEIE